MRIQQTLEQDAPLAKFQNTLSDPDRAALDDQINALRDLGGLAVHTNLTPLEMRLLLLLGKQNRRIECLELLLQKNAERILEWR
jgi:hypothetical protein